MNTWYDENPPVPAPMGVLNWTLAGARFVLISVVISILMVPMLILRWLRYSSASQALVKLACALILCVMGLRVRCIGMPMKMQGGVVANHSSWLDIFVLNAVQQVHFVSKAEVAKWPVIGIIARLVGTIFIDRKQSHAAKHRDTFQNRLSVGHRLLFFPEGTSTDGRRVLTFKSTLFAAFFDPSVRKRAWVQCLTVAYVAPPKQDVRYYGWWGDTNFFPHFFNVLGQFKQGRVTVTFHSPVKVADVVDRKTLAKMTHATVAAGLTNTLDIC